MMEAIRIIQIILAAWCALYLGVFGIAYLDEKDDLDFPISQKSLIAFGGCSGWMLYLYYLLICGVQ